VTINNSINPPYRDSLDNFTDRELILNFFKNFLSSILPGTLRFLTIKGNSGTGKTFLISYLSERICPPLQWQVGQISFTQSQPDFRFILAKLEEALKGCVPRESLKLYRKQRDEYDRSFDDYRAFIVVNQSVEATGFSTVSSSSQSIKINTQLRERELQLRSELSRALLELAEEITQPLCIFIDGYERLSETDADLVGWLLGEILPMLVKSSPQPVTIVTCGWEWPNEASVAPFLYRFELTDFDLEQTKSFLKNQGVFATIDILTEGQTELLAAFYGLTRGHPLVLGLAVTYFKALPSGREKNAKVLQSEKAGVDERARIEFLEERLLNRLPEPHRTLLERGPVLRSFDQATLKTLLSIPIDGLRSDQGILDDRTYSRFLNYPFIKHPIVSSGDLL
jgi:hypothetical protein